MSELNHIHTDDIVIDSDVHFTIDGITRQISNVNGDKVNEKLVLTQYDNKSERYSFDIDRYVDGHDLSLCNRVQVHFINAGSKKEKPNIGVCLIEDAHINESNNKISFSWLISQNATKLCGPLSFLISFECVDGDRVLYRWSTTTYNDIRIIEGFDNGNAIVEQYVDELLTWENDMRTEFIPNMVDECYIEREFATSEEVANIFNMYHPDDETLMSIDKYPTDNSENLVTSGGVKKYTDDTVASALAESKEYTDIHGGKISSISINGVEQTIDENKNVDLNIDAAVEVPTKLSEFENDGDGSSPFATEDYVVQNGGKIDSISVNNKSQTIDENKNVNIDVPTKTSQLTNDGDGDSAFATVKQMALKKTVYTAYCGSEYSMNDEAIVNIDDFPYSTFSDVPTGTVLEIIFMNPYVDAIDEFPLYLNVNDTGKYRVLVTEGKSDGYYNPVTMGGWKANDVLTFVKGRSWMLTMISGKIMNGVVQNANYAQRAYKDSEGHTLQNYYAKETDLNTIRNQYLQNATVSNDVLTITDQSGSKIEFAGGKIDSISVNGITQTIDDNKNINLEIVDKAVSDLDNYYTKEETYSSEEIDSKFENFTGGGTDEDAPFMPIGSIFSSAIPQTDARVHLLDGSTISQTGVYETFANLIKALVSAGNPISCTQTEFDSDVTATGNCGKFVIDDTAGTIRLPKITTFIQGLSSITNIGSSLSAGLPNIIGSFSSYYTPSKMNGSDASGSIYTPQGSGGNYGGNTNSSEYGHGFNFDASRSNSIYGKSTTVQPPATQYPYYIVLASGYKSSEVVDIDNIITDLNNKVSKQDARKLVEDLEGKNIYIETYSGTKYYPIAKFNKSISDGANSSSLSINGKIGSWGYSSAGYITALIWGRDQRGGRYIGTGNITKAFNYCDFVLYEESSTSVVLYLKMVNYASARINVKLTHTSGVELIYDGSYVSTPTGTLIYTMSDQNSDYIIKNTKTDTGGFRKWASGYKEYWGKSSSASVHTINFPEAFSSYEYAISVSPLTDNTSNDLLGFKANRFAGYVIVRTSYVTTSAQGAASVTISYRVAGY